MNRTIIININSIVFHIEEDAYEALRSYMIDIKRHFGNTEGSKEILEDIENRIAEMFNERIESGRKEVINMLDVQEVIGRMGRVSDFEDGQEREEMGYEHYTTEKPFGATIESGKKLMRDPDDKILGGVCSGLGHYFGMEARWVRLLVILFVLIGGSGVLVYIVLWMVMPEALTRADRMAMRGEVPNLQNFKKSFDEEGGSFADKLSGAGEHFSRGARNAGGMLGGCLGLIGKLIAWCILLITGLSIVGFVIFYVFNMMNLFGLENPIIFPPLEVLGREDAVVALTLGFLALLIPFVAFFLLLVRILFKTEKLNNYTSLTMFAVWIVSVVGVIYYCIYANQDFREKSTINVQKDIAVEEMYVFTENDIRILDASDKDTPKSKFYNRFEGQDLRNYMRSDIAISFASLDSLTQPYIQYSYSAKGKTYQLAAERAGNIKYSAIQEGKKILFPSHFILEGSPLSRDQQVRVTVYLPQGAKVVLNNEIRQKTWSVNYGDCLNNYKKGVQPDYTEWTMTDRGLVCAIEAPSAEEQAETEEQREEERKVKAEVRLGESIIVEATVN